MTVVFKCGHRLELPREVNDAPSCRECGERIVARVIGATPRITGSCQSPLKVSA
jgi:hypothetical protein